MMRFHRLCVIGPMWAVLATVAFTPAVHSTWDEPGVGRVSGQPVPGAPAGVTAFVDVSVVPMDREIVLPDQTVLVERGRITAMGPASQVSVPPGAARIDGRGKFLLPGLADMHAHIFHGTHIADVHSSSGMSAAEAPNADSTGAEARLFLWLANGVTTLRNMDYYNADWGRQTLQLRARAADGKSWIPHIYTAGPWGPPSYIWHSGDGKLALDSVAIYVAAYKAAGYDFVKVHNESPVILDSVLATAKRVGIPVAGHVPLPVKVEHVLWGYKSIEHPVNDYLWNGRTVWNPPDTAGITVLAGAMRRAEVWNCPTQSHYDRLHYDIQFSNNPKILKVLQDSGVKLLLGTDELPWLGVITRELQEFVTAGLTPYQALLTGTRNVAAYFGTLDQSGTITVGKRADMVLLTGNPLQDVRYTAQPAGVMLGGRWLRREEIDRRLATFKLPTFTDGKLVTDAPVKSYWNNVLDEALVTAAPLLYGVTLTDTQRTRYTELRTTHSAQRKALIDSLDASNQYATGTQRVLHVIAQQLGDDRMELTPDQRARFDSKARAWAQRRKAEGYSVDVPGV